MSKKQLVAMGLTVLAAAMVALTSGTDAPTGRRDAATKPATRPAQRRRFRSRAGPTRTAFARHLNQDRLTPERIAKVMAFLKKHLPKEHRRIETLQAEEPRQARRMLRRFWRLYQRVQGFPPEIRGAAVARHRLRIAIYTARREFHQADDPAAKAELTGKLRGLLAEQFDQDQIVKEYHLKRLARQLAELKTRIEQRRKDREKIIADQLKGLLRPPPVRHPTSRPGRRR